MQLRFQVCIHFLITSLTAVMALWALPSSAQTLAECQQEAQSNYPLIRRYQLVERTAQADMANISKGWLPQITAYAQVTAQDKVVALPDALAGMLSKQGADIKGITKEQYKMGVDVTQTLYDGGRMKQQKAIVRSQSDVEQAQDRVTLYAVRQRVNDLYFGLLLVEDRLKLNENLHEVLLSNEKKVQNMVKSGTAAASDLYAIQSERINVEQAHTELGSQQQALRNLLSLFIGRPVGQLTRPDGDTAMLSAFDSQDSISLHRPEIDLFDRQLSLLQTREKMLDRNLRPTLSAFAQGFYGYPGLNMYRDMMTRTPTLNGLIGIRAAWNISALYTRKNDKMRLSQQRDMIANQREVFTFNNRLETTRHRANIEKYRRLRAQDEEMICLRGLVRKAAESKLDHGIIDVNDLIKEVNSENAARIQQSTHDIELLREIYNLRYDLNQ